MEMRQLKYFLQISKDKSFSKAANKLFITQQALSQSIKKLECELGISLFERSKNGVELTEISKLIVVDIDDFVKRYDMLYDIIRTKANIEKGSITVGVPPGIVYYFIPNILMPFRHAYPDIQINVVEVPDIICEQKVLEGIFDIGCSVGPDVSEDLVFIPSIKRSSFLLVHKDNPLSEKEFINFEDLKDEPIVTFEEHFKRYHSFIRRCNMAGFQPHILYQSTMLDVLAGLVGENRAVSCFMSDFAHQYAKDPIRLVPFAGLDEYEWVAGFIIKRNLTSNRAVNIFLDFLKNHTMDIQ
jgi:DNA-binding transcriptional LysR family regulator